MADSTLTSIWKPGNLNDNYFQWQHIPYAERVHWNYLLQRVVEVDTREAATSNDSLIDKRPFKGPDPKQIPQPEDPKVSGSCPNFYNQDFCLALTVCPDSNTAMMGTDGDPKSRKNTSEQSTTVPGSFGRILNIPPPICLDFSLDKLDNLYPYLVKPHFNYHRRNFRRYSGNNGNDSSAVDTLLGYNLQSLTVGSLVWLYFYERMGIFKILGVLLDDYNYRGKYSLSSQIRGGALKNKQYIELLEHLSMLTRQGLASTQRDRISTYQRVLGVTIQNDLNVQSAENGSFMKNFSKLIGNMLEYYNAKRLAVAIQNQNNGMQVRSSVATQTAILNTIKVLSQNLEVMEYGRNMIHTFTGIATVYVTLCLIRQIRDVIGIPREYDTPEEYIPAAYDILVLKKQGSPSDSNRYTIFDDCASYGYRILTDVQLASLGNIRLGEANTEFDAWLSNVEEWVEGYNNAFKSIPDKTTSENAVATV